MTYTKKQTNRKITEKEFYLCIYLLNSEKEKNKENHTSHIYHFGIKTLRQIRHSAYNRTDAAAGLCLQRAALCAKPPVQHKLLTLFFFNFCN